MTDLKKVLLLGVCIIILVAFAGRALLAYYGLTVTSWYRSPWKNYEIGGKWFSLHQIGWAYDVIPVNTLLHSVLAVWPFKYVVESDHIHFQIL
jgi:Peptidase M15